MRTFCIQQSGFPSSILEVSLNVLYKRGTTQPKHDYCRVVSDLGDMRPIQLKSFRQSTLTSDEKGDLHPRTVTLIETKSPRGGTRREQVETS